MKGGPFTEIAAIGRSTACSPCGRLGGRRLLVPVASRYLGGAELHTMTLLQELAHTGFAPTCLLEKSACAAELLARFAHSDIAVADAPVACLPDLAADQNRRRQCAAVTRVVAQTSFDGALLPVPWPRHVTGLLEGLRRWRLPTLVLFHQAPEEANFDPVDRAVLDLSLHRPVAVSEDLAERVCVLYGIPRGAVQVIPNGVASVPPSAKRECGALRRRLRAMFGFPAEAPLVLTVARFAESKGYRDLVEAAARLLAERPQVRFLCIGDGPLRADLLAVLRARGLTRQICCPGSFREVSPFYRAADIFFLPTRREGHSLSVTEAAAAGLPLVTTTVSGQDGLLAGTGAALLVPAGAVTEMAGALRRLVDDPVLAGRMGACAAIWASGFTLRDMLAHHVWLLWLTLIGQSPSM